MSATRWDLRVNNSTVLSCNVRRDLELHLCGYTSSGAAAGALADMYQVHCWCMGELLQGSGLCTGDACVYC
jgi:hypothetical protein